VREAARKLGQAARQGLLAGVDRGQALGEAGLFLMDAAQAAGQRGRQPGVQLIGAGRELLAELLAELLQAETNASASRVRAVAGVRRRPARRVIRVLLGGERPLNSNFFKRA
jgi:hypothetical protein